MRNANYKTYYQEGLDTKRASSNETFYGNRIAESEQKRFKRLTINEIRNIIKAKENETPFAMGKIILLLGLMWLIYKSIDIIWGTLHLYNF